jgi:hypothetical protein
MVWAPQLAAAFDRVLQKVLPSTLLTVDLLVTLH